MTEYFLVRDITDELLQEYTEALRAYAPRSCEKKLLEENPDSDYCLYECDVEFVGLKPGNFAVFFPNDIHSPGVMKEKPVKCRKVVMKIKA